MRSSPASQGVCAYGLYEVPAITLEPWMEARSERFSRHASAADADLQWLWFPLTVSVNVRIEFVVWLGCAPGTNTLCDQQHTNFNAVEVA